MPSRTREFERGDGPLTQAVGPGTKATRSATVQEARTQLSRLLAEVESGETVVITRRGRPVAALSPVAPKPRPAFGSMKGRIGLDEEFFDPLPEEELRAWQGV